MDVFHESEIWLNFNLLILLICVQYRAVLYRAISGVYSTTDILPYAYVVGGTVCHIYHNY